MKRILPFLIFVFFISCNEINKTNILKSEYTGYSKHTIDFRDNTIVLTEGYHKVSTEEFVKRLKQLKGKPKFKKIALEQLRKLKKKADDYQLFVDRNNVENYVFVYACNYILFDENSAAKHVSKLSHKIKDESYKQEIRYKRLQGRYFYTTDSKIVKLKYLRSDKKDTKFETEYVIASKSGGIGMIVSNTKNIDFEDSVKRSNLN